MAYVMYAAGLTLLLICSCCHLLFAQPPAVPAQPQNGDVRLNQYGEFESAGVLEIYLNSDWMPVCYDNFNDGAAAAACRQLGYCTFDDVDNYRLVPDENYPKHNISYICDTSDSCPSVKDYAKDGQLHLLRCSGQTQQVQCAPVFLPCKKCELRQYNGKVYLSDNDDSHFKSTGTLYLNYNKKKLPVCAHPFNQFVADSACRQLGYTGAANYIELQENQVSWGMHDINNCQSQSYPCLRKCTSSEFNQISSCVNVFITCTFDPNQSNLPSSGSSQACTIDEGKSSMCEGHVKECATSYPILGLVILAEFFGFGSLLLVLSICIWKKFHQKHAAGGNPPANELPMPANGDNPPDDQQEGERQPLLHAMQN